MEIDGTPGVAFEAGVEKEGSSNEAPLAKVDKPRLNATLIGSSLSIAG